MSDATVKQDIAALESQIENVSEQLNTLFEQQDTQYANIVALLQTLGDKIEALSPTAQQSQEA